MRRCSSGCSRRPGAPRDARARASGALELIDLLHARGVTVSLGHTNATAAEANAAFDRGVRTVTHVFNAMRPLAHRDPGVVGAALVHPERRRPGDRRRRPPRLGHRPPPLEGGGGRIALVTDAIAGAGIGDGTYALGETEIVVADDVVRREDGVLAGSALTMPQAVRNLVEVGVPLENALAAASTVPARVLGLTHVGRLALGGRPTSSSSTTPSRSCRRSSEARPVSPAEPASSPARGSSTRSASSPRRSVGCSSTRTRSPASRGPCVTDLRLVRMVGHGSSDNAASYGVYAFGLLPNWTRCATRSPPRPLRHAARRSTVIGLSQSGRTPDVVDHVKGRERQAPSRSPSPMTRLRPGRDRRPRSRSGPTASSRSRRRRRREHPRRAGVPGRSRRTRTEARRRDPGAAS